MKERYIRLTALITAIALALTSSSCIITSISEKRYVKGEGELAQINLDSGSSPTKLAIELSYVDVSFESDPSKAPYVTLTAQENLLGLVTASSEAGTLTIASEYYIDSDKPITLAINLPGLNAVELSGSGTFAGTSPLSAPSFGLDVSGAFNASLELDCDSFTCVLSGACEGGFSGRADSYMLEVSGVGTVRSFGLAAKAASLRVSGSADVELACSASLDVNISGSGSVRYKGSPSVTRDISGSGTIEQVGE